MKKLAAFAKKTFNVVLSGILAFTLSWGSVPLAYADFPADTGDDPDSFILTVNGEIAGAKPLAYDAYAGFGVQGYSGNAQFFYSPIPASPSSWAGIQSGALLVEPGTYYLGYGYFDTEGDLVLVTDGDYTVTIVKGTMPEAVGLAWDGTAATWSAASPSDSGTVVYQLELLKDGAEVATASTSDKRYDFAGAIQAAGYGTYTFTVTTLNTNFGNHYNSAATSEPSGAFVYADTNPPIVTGFGRAESGTVGATIADAESGVAAYAFVVGQPADADWVPYVLAPNQYEYKTFRPAGTGEYRLYVKDAFGNVTVSVESATVTEVVLQGYYDGATAAPKSLYLIGESDYANLPTEADMGRVGFTFEGWYDNAAFDGYPVTGTAVAGTYYGKWSSSFDVTVESISKVYDKQPVSLTATLPAGVSGITGYQWFKRDADGFAMAIDGATSATFAVTTPDDNGTYYVEVYVGAETRRSNSATVEIAPATLTVQVESFAITFGQDAPEFTAEVKGLFEGDSFEKGTLTCDYVAGSPVDTYDIIASGYSALYYDVKYIQGVLTVNAEAFGDDISAQLTETVLPWTGSAVEPGATVTAGEDTLQFGVDYTINYADNVEIGAATAEVVGIGNYSGKVTLPFTIVPATFASAPVLEADSWTYNATPVTVTASANPEEGAITWYYTPVVDGQVDPAQRTTVQPVNAGTYEVYGVISATDHYESVTTSTATFTINPVDITINVGVSGALSWTYDGLPHSNTTYEVEGDFVGSDDMRFVSVGGSITNAGTVQTQTTWGLNASAVPANYNIIINEATLEVAPRPLPAPTDVNWSAAEPGVADWLDVVRSGVDVRYELKLYRANGDLSPVGVQTSDISEFDLRELARTLSGENVNGFYFTVTAIPAGGANAGNYSASPESAPSDMRYVAVVNVVAGEGIASAQVVRASSGTSTIAPFITGETVTVQATLQEGYEFGEIVWTWEGDAAQYITVNHPELAITTLYAGALIEAPCTMTLTAHAVDSAPVIESFTAQNCPEADLTQVIFNFEAMDATGIEAWVVSATEPADDDWTLLAEPALTLADSVTLTQAGAYNLYVRDINGNVTVSEDPLHIYTIDFSGNGNDSGQMPVILKGENAELTLPANTFGLAGSSFISWKSSATGEVFMDGGQYLANGDDTLVAQWSADAQPVTINVFRQNTDGSYSADPDAVRSINSPTGTVLAAADMALMAGAGFAMDMDLSKDITVTAGADNVMNLYFARNSHTITYVYTDPVTGEDVVYETETYLFEENTEAAAGPDLAALGYIFMGWSTASGSVPATMPDEDIVARAVLTPAEAVVTTGFYMENLDGTLFVLDRVDPETETHHGSPISASVAKAPYIEGFACVGVEIASAAAPAAGIAPEDISTAAEVSGTVDASAGAVTEIRYFYERIIYTLTLNVWKGVPGEPGSAVIYTTNVELPYGAPIPAGFAEGDAEAWGIDPATAGIEDRILAEYTDWSTGMSATAPTTMPAGDVTATRQFIKDEPTTITVNLYTENANGTYSKVSSVLYSTSAGKVVTAGTDAEDLVQTDSFGNLIDYFSMYTLNEELSTTTTPAPADGSGQLDLYFERIETTTTVNYYAVDENGNRQIGTATVTGKWGTTAVFDPVMYFGNATEPGSYCADRYIVEWTGKYYWPYDYRGYSWANNGRLRTEASLTATHTMTLGMGNGDVINVYYEKPSDVSYVVNILYNDGALLFGTGSGNPVTVTYNGTDYPLRAANKIDILTYTQTDGALYPKYPGLEDLNINNPITYGAPRPGYTAISIDGVTCYLSDDGYIYLTNDANDFLLDLRPTYSFPGFADAHAPFNTVPAYGAEYRQRTDDPKAPIVNYWTYGYDALLTSTTGVQNYTAYEFYYREVYVDVDFVINGGYYNGGTYAYGTAVSASDLRYPTVEQREGYEVKWYADPDFTTAIEDFVITSNKLFYGRYEKIPLTHTQLVFYQLAADGTYANAADLDDITLYKAEEADGIVSYYSLDTLELVAKKSTLPGEAFELVTSTYADEAYQVANYHYDEKYAGNMLQAFAETEPITLRAYYARDMFTLVVNPNYKRDNQVSIDTVAFGTEVKLDTPSQDGYVFVDWEITVLEPGTPIETMLDEIDGYLEDAPEVEDTIAAVTSIVMPATNVIATAIWAPAEFEIEIVYHFADGKKEYSITRTHTEEFVSEAEYSLVAYLYQGEWEYESSDPIDLDMYKFSHVIFKTVNQSSYSEDETYVIVADYTMSLDLYYDGVPVSVTAQLQATDGGAVTGNEILTGTGTYSYLQEDTLSVRLVDDYTLVGWYAAADVVDGVPAEGAVALSTDVNYTFNVMEDTDLVALLEPAAPEASIQVSGKTAYEFGYKAGGSNVLTAAVTVSNAADLAGDANVTRYVWYEELDGQWVPVVGYNGSTLPFPVGKEAGVYNYKCEAQVVLASNGRTVTVESDPITVKVQPSVLEVTAEDYSGEFDGEKHTITLTIPEEWGEDYEVYYSTRPLDASNFATLGVKAPVQLRDVTDTTVYYYVKSTTLNYADVAGSAQITITPKTVGVKAGSGVYSKPYDGTTAVSYDHRTDIELNAGNYYEIVGLVPSDQNGDFVLGFKVGTFDDKDCEDVTSIKLEILYIAYLAEDGMEVLNDNYRVAVDSLTIAGAITPLTLPATWSDTELAYNGEQQVATVALDTAKLSAKVAALVASDGVSLVATGAQTNAGTYTATAAVAGVGSTNYRVDEDTLTSPFIITPRAITLAAEKAGITYDGEFHGFSGEDFSAVEGALVEGHTLTVTLPAIEEQGETRAWSQKDAGTYTVTPAKVVVKDAAGRDVTENYAITLGEAKLVIDPKVVTAEIAAADKIYDGTTAAEITVTVETGIQGDALEISGLTGTFAGKDVVLENDAPVAQSVTVDATGMVVAGVDGTLVANYMVQVPEAAEAVISPKHVTVDYAVEDRVYDGTTDVPVTGTIETGVDGETLIVVDVNAAYEHPHVQTAGEIYVYGLDIHAGDDTLLTNYIIDAERWISGNITPKPIVAVVTAEDKTYDGTTDAVAQATVETGVEEDSLTISDVKAAFATKNVGEDITVTVTNTPTVTGVGDTHASDYTVTYGTAVADIEKLQVTVTIDEQIITYGDGIPAFTATPAAALPKGDTVADLGLTYSTTYNPSDPAKRGSDAYTITATAAENTNYDVTIYNGDLYVLRRPLHITVNNAEMYYKGTVPEYSVAVTAADWQYEDEAALASQVAVSYAVTDGTSTDPATFAVGEYAISGTAQFELDNYLVQVAPGKLVVKPVTVKISGIAAEDKVYDGTTAVVLDFSAMEFTGYYPADDVDVNVGAITGAFATATAGADKTVNLTYTEACLTGADAGNYTFVADTQKTTEADITKRPVLVTAKDATVKYGQEAANNGVSYGEVPGVEVSGLVSGESISPALTYTYNVAADGSGAAYEAGSDVGTYAIIPASTSELTNYTMSFAPGTLTVTQAQFGAPVATWSTTAPGTITWNAIAPIGKVEPAQYVVTLYADGDVLTTATLPATETSKDFAETIRANGPGAYTVSVQTIASEVSNAGKANVADSLEGAQSAKLYAANVELVFADDNYTGMGAGTATVDGAASVVKLAGETVALAATLNPDTYTGFTATASVPDGRATVSGQSQDAANNYAYSGTATVVPDLSSADDITIVVTLEPRPATVQVELTTSLENWRRSYGIEGSTITAVPSPAAGDVYADDTYSYTFAWSYAEFGTSNWIAIQETGDTWTIPQFLDCANYTIRCDVTATRADNGKTASTTATQLFRISRASMRPENTYIVTTDWIYGQSRITPELIGQLGDGQVTFQYAATADATTWTNGLPTAAGDWFLRADIAQCTNYFAFVTNPVAVTVEQAQLQTPTGLTLGASGTAGYGLITWDAVTDMQSTDGATVVPGLKENAGAADSASTVGVTYSIQLQRADGAGWVAVGEPAVQAGTAYDFTALVNGRGTYRVAITALSNRTDDCLDSEVAISPEFEITGEIETLELEKVYDGKPLTLVSVFSDETMGSTFQWYKDGEAIPGATGDTLSIYAVAETGVYTCEMTTGNDVSYATTIKATITKCPVTITADPKTQVYGDEAKELTWSEEGWPGDPAVELVVSLSRVAGENVGTYTITPGAAEAANPNYAITWKTGAYTITQRPVTATAEDNGKVYGTADPELTFTAANMAAGEDESKLTVTLKREAGEDVADYAITASGAESQGNYSVAFAAGVFTISQKTLTDAETISVADIASLVYTGKAQEPTPVVTYARTNGLGTETLVLGKDFTVTYADNTNVGTATVTITGMGNFKDSITVEFDITPAPVVVTADAAGKTYGTADPKLTAQVSGMVNGESTDLITYTVTREAGEAVDLYAIVPAGDELQGNYSVTYETADFTISPKDIADVVTVAFEQPDDVTYSGSAFEPEPAGTYERTNGLGTEELWKDLDVTYSYEANVNAGTAKVIITGTGNFTGTVERTFTIKPFAVTVTPDDNTKVYSGVASTDPTLTYSNTDLPTGANPDALDVQVSREAGENVGHYTITATQEEGANPNYAITFETGDFEITPATITNVSAIQAEQLIYNGEPQTAAVTTAATTVNDQPTTFTYSTSPDGPWSAQVPAFTEKGSYTVYFTVSAPNHYDATGTLVIAIDADKVSKPQAPTDKVYNGLVQVGEVTTSALYTIVNEGGKNVGTYDVVYTLKDPANYTWTDGTTDPVAYTFNITPAPVTLSADEATKVYSGNPATDPAFTATATGLVNGEPQSLLTYTVSRTEDGEDVGTYAIMVSGETEQGNYTVSYVGNVLNITPATITNHSVTQAAELTYNGAAQVAEVTIVATTVNDQPTTFLYSTTPDGPWGTAVPALTASGTVTLYYKVSAPNHYDATGSFDVTIGKKAVTVTADQLSKIYGYPDPDLTATVEGVVADGAKAPIMQMARNARIMLLATPSPVDSVIVYSVERETGEDVGEYAVTVTGETVQGDYIVTFVGSTFTIEPEPVTDAEHISIADIDPVTYDGTAQTPQLTITYDKPDGSGVETLVEGKDFTAVYADNIAAGPATITITGVGNYTDETIVEFTIEPAKITITAENKEKVYSADPTTDPELTYLVELPAAGDALNGIVISRQAGEDVGDYVITVEAEADAANPNYDITFVPATFTILHKEVTVTAEDKTKRRGDDDPELTVVIEGVIPPAVDPVDPDDPEGEGEGEGETPEFDPATVITVTVSRETTPKGWEPDPDDPDAPLPTGEEPGEYAIIATGDEYQGNYHVTYVDGTLTILNRIPGTGDATPLNGLFALGGLAVLGAGLALNRRKKYEEQF